MQRVKSFTDYSLKIIAEIYIIFRSELIRQMNSGPYSLGTNGSNDKSGIKKVNPVLIRLFDDGKGNAQLLDMGACKEGTAEVLFNNIDSILRKNKVDWEYPCHDGILFPCIHCCVVQPNNNTAD